MLRAFLLHSAEEARTGWRALNDCADNIIQSSTFTWSIVLLRKLIFTLLFSLTIVSSYPFNLRLWITFSYLYFQVMDLYFNNFLVIYETIRKESLNIPPLLLNSLYLSQYIMCVIKLCIILYTYMISPNPPLRIVLSRIFQSCMYYHYFLSLLHHSNNHMNLWVS